MVVKLVGVQPINFVSRDGNNISGIKVFFNYVKDQVSGYACGDKFLSESLCTSLQVTSVDLQAFLGRDIDFDIDFNGKVTAISTVSGDSV